jgi:aerobic-type carbon monoxide dehydrogenase small subunit (CoxS/CutS family)
MPVSLLINGKPTPARVEPRDTLAHVLREQLGLTGTKIGCDRGACGACTVWVDGVPTPACMTLALEVAGSGGRGGRPPRAVTTIEGLATAGGKLHPVQQAFLAHDAMQCGFCTPGMVMSCAALYEQKRAQGKLAGLDEAAVREAISGNLCRCGTYPHVVSAMLTAKNGPPPGGKGPGGAPAGGAR